MSKRDHSRKRGLSVEQRLWYALRRGGPAKPCDLAVTTEVTVTAARNGLLRLLNKGCVSATGITNDRRYTAIPSRRPEDMRGTAVGSYEALREFTAAAKHRRRIATSRPRVLAGIPLEQHWKGINK